MSKGTSQTMQTSDIEHEIRLFLVSNFLFGREDALKDDATLFGSVIDSTGVIELVMFLQEKFSITIDDDEVAVPENFESLRSVVAFIAVKLRAKA